MEEKINRCPRCGAEMTVREAYGDMLDMPFVELRCSWGDCQWNMRFLCDNESDPARVRTREKLIRMWNEGTSED